MDLLCMYLFMFWIGVLKNKCINLLHPDKLLLSHHSIILRTILKYTYLR